MKIFLSPVVLLILVACKSTQTDLPILQNCPQSGDCEVQVLKETKLFIEENSSEISKISFEEDKNFQVVFIQYKDSKREGYSEEIYLQIPSQFKEIQSQNHSLQNQKVVFGKLCKCDESGFERINQGKLQLVNLKNHISLHLELESNKEQIIKSIDIEI